MFWVASIKAHEHATHIVRGNPHNLGTPQSDVHSRAYERWTVLAGARVKDSGLAQNRGTAASPKKGEQFVERDGSATLNLQELGVKRKEITRYGYDRASGIIASPCDEVHETAHKRHIFAGFQPLGYRVHVSFIRNEPDRDDVCCNAPGCSLGVYLSCKAYFQHTPSLSSYREHEDGKTCFQSTLFFPHSLANQRMRKMAEIMYNHRSVPHTCVLNERGITSVGVGTSLLLSSLFLLQVGCCWCIPQRVC